MALFATSLIAGFLTILAPCILPLLPVTLGGAVAEAGNRRRPFVIIASLSVSVFAFTLLLKGSTALLDVSPTFWTYVSAGILALFGLTLVFPYAWARIVLKIPGHNRPDSWMASGYKHRGEWWADILVGAALGPIFTTCSPTFFLILATVLPQSLGAGIVDLLAYVAGLAIALLLVAWIGQKLVNRLEWATNPTGWFRRTLGVLFVLVAVVIAAGWDKQAESAILRAGFFDVTTLEQQIRQVFERMPTTVDQAQNGSACDPSEKGCFLPEGAATSTIRQMPKPSGQAGTPDINEKIPGEVNGGRYTEIVSPAGFVNSAPFRLADLIGKKVILVDFIDYSCINCERTFPYMADWWKKYKDQGLEIVAIHTPEFSFERDIKNVTAAAKQFGLEFPIVLDNSYATWNAYRNQYWPHKYIIDIHGRVVYEHIGEGEYDLTEKEIVKQLNIRKMVLGESGAVAAGTTTMPRVLVQAASPETYFGAMRNEYFGNGTPGKVGDARYEAPIVLDSNRFYLDGSWHIDSEYIESAAASSTISYEFAATRMYLVAESKDSAPKQAWILLDGIPMPAAVAGDDVKDGILTVNSSRLYNIYKNSLPGSHRIDIIWKKPGARLYTFTFG